MSIIVPPDGDIVVTEIYRSYIRECLGEHSDVHVNTGVYAGGGKYTFTASPIGMTEVTDDWFNAIPDVPFFAWLERRDDPARDDPIIVVQMPHERHERRRVLPGEAQGSAILAFEGLMDRQLWLAWVDARFLIIKHGNEEGVVGLALEGGSHGY